MIPSEERIPFLEISHCASNGGEYRGIDRAQTPMDWGEADLAASPYRINDRTRQNNSLDLYSAWSGSGTPSQ